MSIASKISSIFALMLLFSVSVGANPRITVLDFELNDLTSNPRVPEEVERTASLKSLLEKRLAVESGYKIIPVDSSAQMAATQAFGYLWNYPDEAAVLGESHETQFIVVGRVTKPSFLFSFFEARLIDVKSRKVVGEFCVEVKGQKQITLKGVENLARKIDEKLQAMPEAHT